MGRAKCRYNPELECKDTAKCGTCGWNPEVAQRRIREWKENEAKKRKPAMTYFEKITASRETLAAFLASLQVLDGPWDLLFQATFCTNCMASDCSSCPHEAQRRNPAWFLEQKVMEDGNGTLW